MRNEDVVTVRAGLTCVAVPGGLTRARQSAGPNLAARYGAAAQAVPEQPPRLFRNLAWARAELLEARGEGHHINSSNAWVEGHSLAERSFPLRMGLAPTRISTEYRCSCY
jgi:hypothetical protein